MRGSRQCHPISISYSSSVRHCRTIKKPSPRQGAKAQLRGTTLVLPFSLRLIALTNRQRSFIGPSRGRRVSPYISRTNQGSGSEASSSFPFTGLHQPPALWKKDTDYYSSSQPLKNFCNDRKTVLVCQGQSAFFPLTREMRRCAPVPAHEQETIFQCLVPLWNAFSRRRRRG
jgi:hypothetical protein